MPPAALHGADREYDEERHDEQRDDGQCRAVAGTILGEEAPVDREAYHLCRGAGAAARQQIDLVEDLECHDEAKDQCHNDGRQHHRQTDVDQLLPSGGAVDARRLVDVLRETFNTGEEE